MGGDGELLQPRQSHVSVPLGHKSGSSHSPSLVYGHEDPDEVLPGHHAGTVHEQ